MCISHSSDRCVWQRAKLSAYTYVHTHMHTYILNSSGANSQKQLVEVVYTDTDSVPSLKVDPALQVLGLQLLPKQGPLLLCVVLLDKFPAPPPPSP